MTKEKKWHEKINYNLLQVVFTILTAIFVYFESTNTSSHETKKDIAVLQAQYIDIKEVLADIKTQVYRNKNNA